jgi:hypothetical protein
MSTLSTFVEVLLRTASFPLQTLAVLQGSATINEHWDFLGTVSGVVQARFPHHFYRAVVNAATR